MKRTALMSAFLLLFAAACDSGGKGGGADGKPTDKTADSKPLTDDQVDSADLPVEEDFEEEATKEINEDNLDDQVAALEKEIDADTE
jgi:hypothetical protein